MKRYQVKALRALGQPAMYFVIDMEAYVPMRVSMFYLTREEAYMESVKLSLKAMEESA